MDKPFGTALSTIQAVPNDTRERLRELNITTAEEVVALAAIEGTRENLAQHLGVPAAEVAKYLEAARSSLPNRVVEAMEQSSADNLGLGALEPPPEAMLAGAGPYESVVDPASLPASVNHISRMPTIRNQWSRGTCVAFACTALNEDYSTLYRGSTPDLSEQCLYKRCKETDGAPNAEGTWVSAGMNCLVNNGEATESCESYNPNPPTNQPGPHPACCTSGSTQWKLPLKQQLNPKSVTDIKAALADNKVVAFAIPVYHSWYDSAAVKQSGNITMPLPGENSFAGHAMLFVGYQDDAATPGGGYFILRNSWGTTAWGSKCAYGAGYGTIPYKYMTDTGREAFTYQKPVGDVPVPLYRYWNSGIGDHFYTTNWSELGSGKYGWQFESIQCYVHEQAVSGAVPLYRYWNSQAGDHFYTTNWNELGYGKYGWAFESIQCYVHTQAIAGAVPLYRYWNAQAGDHFYTTNWSELGSGKYGWVSEGVQCYVHTQQVADLSGNGGTDEEESAAPPATFTTAGHLVGGLAWDVPASFQTECGASGAETVPGSFQVTGEEVSETVPDSFRTTEVKPGDGAERKAKEEGKIRIVLELDR